MSHEKSAIKKIRATGKMREAMGEYFGELDEASRTGSEKVAWCTSGGPAELLRSFGFLVYFPENHGALLGSSRMAADLIPAATAAGYSPEICSYLTSDVGSYLTKTTPLTKAFGMESVPKPDVLVYNTIQCRDVQDWFAFYRREWGVPMLGIQTPRSVDELDAAIVDGLIQQHKDLIPHLEQISGRYATRERFLTELTLDPSPEYVDPLPVVVKLHVLSFYAFLVVFPFTRLVHIVTLPLGYLVRPWQRVVRTEAPPAVHHEAADKPLERVR